MKHLRKPLALLLLLTLCLTALVGCAPEWKDDYVQFSRDGQGQPVITFTDDFAKSVKQSDEAITYSSNMYEKLSFREIMEDTVASSSTNSLVLIKIVRRLEAKEAKSLGIDKTDPTILMHGTVYEAVIIYDYLADKPLNERVYYATIFATVTNQRRGEPPLSPGDCLITFENGSYPEFIYASGCILYSADREQVTADTVVRTMERIDDARAEAFALPLTDADRVVQSEFKNNPWRFEGQYRLGDVIELIRQTLAEVSRAAETGEG